MLFNIKCIIYNKTVFINHPYIDNAQIAKCEVFIGASEYFVLIWKTPTCLCEFFILIVYVHLLTGY